MRFFLIVSFLLLPLNLAAAVNLGPTAEPKPAPGEPYVGGGRVGGDTVLDATVIPSFPFADTGNTCGYANDYDAVCPYPGSTAPDVVYAYEATIDAGIRVDLCASGYDTKVYVCADDPENILACSDDAGCGVDGYRSQIDNLNLTPGHTYYIVVDGYGAECGSYDLAVYPVPVPPCLVGCPPNAQLEGEPPCVDGYVDVYNAGCDGGFTPIEPQSDSTGVVCGWACTFLYQGSEYRDTDWYTVVAAGGASTATCRSAFPLQLLIIYGLDCSALEYTYGTGPACDLVTLSWTFAPDQEFWIWVGPSVFEGVPMNGYVLEVTGIGPSAPIGACCSNSYCYLETEQRCEAYGTYLGDETDCEPNPCGPQPPGACCLLDGGCQLQPQAICLALAGIWLGAGTDCEPLPCPDPTPVERTSWGRIKNAFR